MLLGLRAGMWKCPQVTGERNVAGSQNTGSRADGRTGAVRSTAIPEQTWCGGEQRVWVGMAVEPAWWSRPGCEWFAESLLCIAPKCCDGWQV